MSPEARAKSSCRRTTNYYIRRGILIPKPCQFFGCGEQLVQPHHDDYSKPLDVTWLCRLHHLLIEGKTMQKSNITSQILPTRQ
jgi:hypothetical protein